MVDSSNIESHKLRTFACWANLSLCTTGSFNSVYALQISFLHTNSSNRSVSPGIDRCLHQHIKHYVNQPFNVTQPHVARVQTHPSAMWHFFWKSYGGMSLQILVTMKPKLLKWEFIVLTNEQHLLVQLWDRGCMLRKWKIQFVILAAMASSVCPSVSNNFAVYTITLKNTGVISSKYFVDTLGSLGQHQSAFGFCGSTRSIEAAGSVHFEYSCLECQWPWKIIQFSYNS